MSPPPPLTLPCDPAELDWLVSEHWPRAAQQAGVDPAVTAIGTSALVGGSFGLYWLCPGPMGGVPGAGIYGAFAALSDALEDAGLIIDRAIDLHPRVLGWAAHHFGRGRHREPAPTRLVDRAPWHPVVKAWRSRLANDRAARDAREAPR